MICISGRCEFETQPRIIISRNADEERSDHSVYKSDRLSPPVPACPGKGPDVFVTKVGEFMHIANWVKSNRRRLQTFADNGRYVCNDIGATASNGGYRWYLFLLPQLFWGTVDYLVTQFSLLREFIWTLSVLKTKLLQPFRWYWCVFYQCSMSWLLISFGENRLLRLHF